MPKVRRVTIAFAEAVLSWASFLVNRADSSAKARVGCNRDRYPSPLQKVEPCDLWFRKLNIVHFDVAVAMTNDEASAVWSIGAGRQQCNWPKEEREDEGERPATMSLISEYASVTIVHRVIDPHRSLD